MRKLVVNFLQELKKNLFFQYKEMKKNRKLNKNKLEGKIFDSYLKSFFLI